MLADGSCVGYYINTMWSGNPSYYFLVDANCDKNPNIPGKDLYVFVLDDHAFLTPVDSDVLVELDDIMKEYMDNYEDYYDDDGWSDVVVDQVAFMSVYGHNWEITYY